MTERCRLYLITPPKFELHDFAEILKRTLAAGDVASLQLRLKDVPDEEIVQATEILMPIAQKADVAFIINDRPDLAKRLGCDGVHVGQEDASYAEARAVLGPDRIVGVTCHDSRHLAIEAGEAGADYVAFGAFFPTQTKAAKTQAGLDLLTWWSDLMVVPCVAIGGIRIDNAKPLVEAGADFLAVSAGVWDHPGGPEVAVKAFNALF
ncbi:MAG: thiamine phosphate synthase [Alphaproteobacteria bacterium]|nr:thiamine phosphate synthase [Alphaproteobacteria bacterium]MDE2163233.1 thiamine phosphate synthase [Alphaproteobacteria bacterium]MDE2265858.1 thiamine phosphate synthase [Alphaproteobacteria bacterium]MDE2499906.1 thiamine phosphate synthase [Alphaproteobacteria bacterium]